MKMGWIFYAAVFSTSAFSNQIEMGVTLSPAGSFVAKADKISVDAFKRTGSDFTARNITVDLSTIKTGIGMRDGHMKEKYMEVDKYPKATLTGVVGKGGKFQGTLELHGQSKPVSGTYEFKDKELVAKFKVKSSEFKIAQASYKGVGVEDDVDVTAKLAVEQVN